MPILSETHPALVDEWHPYLNLPLKSDGDINGRKQKIWWICKKDPEHVFWSTLSSRTPSKAGGCRYCSGKEVLKEHSLSKIDRDIAGQWHLEKNNDQYPFEFSPGSNKKVWWKCPKGNDHEWRAVIYERTRKERRNTCPFCAGRKLSVTNSPAAKNPELAKQFNERKNKCKPEDAIASQKGKNQKNVVGLL